MNTVVHVSFQAMCFSRYMHRSGISGSTLLTKVCIVRVMVFSSSKVQWELDHQEVWAPKNWCFRIVVLEKTLQSPLDCKEINPMTPKGNQPWVFIGKTDAETETPILWPPDGKSWLIGKDPDAEKDGRQEEKGMTEGEMVRQHHQFNWHEFEQTPGYSGGERSLACCSPWGRKEWDST